eukprot:TRINITY_DN1718_c0_g1_i1.p1 TRINITY_DN1718_c0_g1~~TRINITY_DN1718_c0_g1_i1.p1  ORF type:complete len:408 (-),score=63.70 TRINITY_DN1718_c0_g1_i1:53-1276(-)
MASHQRPPPIEGEGGDLLSRNTGSTTMPTPSSSSSSRRMRAMANVRKRKRQAHMDGFNLFALPSHPESSSQSRTKRSVLPSREHIADDSATTTDVLAAGVETPTAAAPAPTATTGATATSTATSTTTERTTAIRGNVPLLEKEPITHSFQRVLFGRSSSHFEYGVFSATTNRLLRPYIRRDSESMPLFKQLLIEIQHAAAAFHTRRELFWRAVTDGPCHHPPSNGDGDDGRIDSVPAHVRRMVVACCSHITCVTQPYDHPSSLVNHPIDYCYFQPTHLLQVNALLSKVFWPGINVSELLDCPDHSVVATYRHLVVGCAFMNQKGYISYVAVREEWRRAGIASFMLYHLVQTNFGCDTTLHVSATNHAMLLYQRFGFKAEGFVVDFYKQFLPKDSQECPHALFLRRRR